MGSTGSSHLKKIISSNGVKVSDSGAMPPGTAQRKRQNSVLSKVDSTLMNYREKGSKTTFSVTTSKDSNVKLMDCCAFRPEDKKHIGQRAEQKQTQR